MDSASASTHQRIVEGDMEAFQGLFKGHYRPLCHSANRLLRDMELAQEVVQEFFYTYWKNRGTIMISSSLTAYMYQSVRNLALKQLERRQVREKYIAWQSDNAEASPWTSADPLEADELHQAVEDTLSRMPSRCRQVFLLSRTEGLKYQEIANRLGISVKTVEADMGKALQRFRIALRPFTMYPL